MINTQKWIVIDDQGETQYKSFAEAIQHTSKGSSKTFPESIDFLFKP
jgi:hypothetical protein